LAESITSARTSEFALPTKLVFAGKSGVATFVDFFRLTKNRTAAKITVKREIAIIKF
jgi:hypothetical protein